MVQSAAPEARAWQLPVLLSEPAGHDTVRLQASTAADSRSAMAQKCSDITEHTRTSQPQHTVDPVSVSLQHFFDTHILHRSSGSVQEDFISELVAQLRAFSCEKKLLKQQRTHPKIVNDNTRGRSVCETVIWTPFQAATYTVAARSSKVTADLHHLFRFDKLRFLCALCLAKIDSAVCSPIISVLLKMPGCVL